MSSTITVSKMSMVSRVDEDGSEGAAATAIMMSRMLFVPKVVFESSSTLHFLFFVFRNHNSVVVYLSLS